MNQNNLYFKQVKLLVQVLPVIAKYPCFALKGGTAINLFVHDLPRLSVDIDLCYLPVEERDVSLQAIQKAMLSIQQKLEQQGYRITPNHPDHITRLLVERDNVRIKVELSPVLRGSVHPAKIQRIQANVEKLFGYAEIQLLDFDDLYAGKICAALDRQHPRDLFDCKLLLENEGITERLKDTFLVYLMSHARPISELLSPNLKAIDDSFEKEFRYMTKDEVSLIALENTRKQLIQSINNKLSHSDKKFLLSLKQGQADWDCFKYPEAQKLPAVRWKEYNLAKMKKAHRTVAIEKLENTLSIAISFQ